MTAKQKILDYLRSHREPFTIDMLRIEVGVSHHTLNGYLSRFVQDGLVAYAEPKVSAGKPDNFFKPRKYKAV